MDFRFLADRRFKVSSNWIVFCLIALIVLLIEVNFYGLLRSLQLDTPPQFDRLHLFRTLIFSVFSAIAIGCIHFAAKQAHHQPRIQQNLQWASFQHKLLTTLLLSNLAVLGLLLVSPKWFSKLALEDNPVECLTTLFFLVGAGILGWQVQRIRQQRTRHQGWLMLGLGLLAAVFFVIAMEEISWFQRLVNFQTPDTFSQNLQNEVNLHNFATSSFEYAFYTSSFLFLVLLPYIRLMVVRSKSMGVLGFFTADSFVLSLSALAVAYNYDMWNGLPIQIAFFTTLFLLISLWLMAPPGRERLIFTSLISTLIVTQLVFLLWGHTMPREWDATEYKECLIGFGFFLYSLNIRHKVSRLVETQ